MIMKCIINQNGNKEVSNKTEPVWAGFHQWEASDHPWCLHFQLKGSPKRSQHQFSSNHNIIFQFHKAKLQIGSVWLAQSYWVYSCKQKYLFWSVENCQKILQGIIWFRYKYAETREHLGLARFNSENMTKAHFRI